MQFFGSTRLNAVEVVPRNAYRRNALVYPLVCYVNNIIGLYLSGNNAVISVFVGRAYEFMVRMKRDNPTLYGEEAVYFDVVLEYLQLMARFVIDDTAISEQGKAMIPLALRKT
jgi:hypothetical protein